MGYDLEDGQRAFRSSVCSVVFAAPAALDYRWLFFFFSRNIYMLASEPPPTLRFPENSVNIRIALNLGKVRETCGETGGSSGSSEEGAFTGHWNRGPPELSMTVWATSGIK